MLKHQPTIDCCMGSKVLVSKLDPWRAFATHFQDPLRKEVGWYPLVWFNPFRKCHLRFSTDLPSFSTQSRNFWTGSQFPNTRIVFSKTGHHNVFISTNKNWGVQTKQQHPPNRLDIQLHDLLHDLPAFFWWPRIIQGGTVTNTSVHGDGFQKFPGLNPNKKWKEDEPYGFFVV